MMFVPLLNKLGQSNEVFRTCRIINWIHRHWDGSWFGIFNAFNWLSGWFWVMVGPPFVGTSQMNIKALKELIADLPDSTIVVLSRDEEGNGFCEASGFSLQYNYKDGEIGLAKLTEEDKEKGYTEGDLLKGKKALVLWP